MNSPSLPDVTRNERSVRVLRQFRVVFNAVKIHFRTIEKSAGLAGAQAWALSVVRDQPGIGVGGLAQAMDVHQSTASNLLAALYEKELVVAGRAATDRRSVQLRITAKGRRVLAKVPAPFEGLLPDALNRLDPARLAALEQDLAAVIDLLGVARKGANIPLGQPGLDFEPSRR